VCRKVCQPMLPYRPHMNPRLPHDPVQNRSGEGDAVAYRRVKTWSGPGDVRLSGQSNGGNDRGRDHQRRQESIRFLAILVLAGNGSFHLTHCFHPLTPCHSLSLMDAPLPCDQSPIQPVGERTPENVRRKVAPLLSAQRAVGQDPGAGHGFDGGGNVLAAGLAAEDEFAFPRWGDVEHRASIGEQKAKIKDWGCGYLSS